MVGLPRAIIKKYGVTKKAWAVYRGSKSTTKKTRIRKTRKSKGVKVMSKRRSSRRRSSGGFGMGKLMSQKNLIGTIGGAIAGRYIGINPSYTAAIGAYAYGKSGIPGAAIAYFGAPVIVNATSGLMGKATNQVTQLY
jgi:hypothetical protein